MSDNLLVKELNAADERMRAAFSAALLDVGLEIERSVVDYIEARGHQVEGALKQSINTQMDETPEQIAVKVGTALWYAIYVHEPTKPHWAPLNALRVWVHRKFGLTGEEVEKKARAVQFAIAKRGTKAHPFLKDVFKIYRPKIERMVADRVREKIK